jgi:exonuclease SbcC
MIRAIAKNLEAEKSKRIILQKQFEQAKTEKDNAEQNLKTNEPLIVKAREIIVWLTTLKTTLQERQTRFAELSKTTAEIENGLQNRARQQREALDNVQRMEAQQKNLALALERYRQNQEKINEEIAELSVFSATAGFEENRKTLIDGEPCPLCGSLAHPYCADEKELRKKQERLKAIKNEKIKLSNDIKQAEFTAKKNENEKAAMEKTFQKYETNQATEAAILDSNKKQLVETRHDIDRLSGEFNSLNNERKATLDVDNIDVFEKRLKEKNYYAVKTFSETDKQLSNNGRDMENLSKQLLERNEEYAKYQRIFLENQELQNGDYQSVKAESVKAEKEKFKQSIEQINQNIGEKKNRLESNRKAKERKARYQKEIDEQKIKCGQWKRMDDWIGGLNGWKFKNYVQAITLKALVHNANTYLLSMSAQRYSMISKQDDSELLPVIIDNNQGSIERTISNLSGGERFMLSLSLALGLSKLNSSKLSIDSLFLDEGFGTLDKESLELTINILNGLKQHQGKLTGIISHVEELQERIAASIEVIKTGGGRSKLEGCGVTSP